jgi:hypothetical protein
MPLIATSVAPGMALAVAMPRLPPVTSAILPRTLNRFSTFITQVPDAAEFPANMISPANAAARSKRLRRDRMGNAARKPARNAAPPHIAPSTLAQRWFHYFFSTLPRISSKLSFMRS